jgi:hypothetical protein
MRVEMIFEDAWIRDNGAKACAIGEYSLACPRIEL